MNKRIVLCALSAAGTMFISGCQALEDANSGVQAVGRPVGQAARLPQSATQGITDGYVGEKDPNPFGR